MFTSPQPTDSPDELLAYLADPLRAVRDAIDDGVSYADGLLYQQPYDAWFWSHAARYRARHQLSATTSGSWKLGRLLPNSGIELVRDLLVLRVLKQQGGQPPNPGLNTARREYYLQQNLGLTIVRDGVRLPSPAKLVVDWTVGSQREVVLALSKPAGLWRYWERPVLEWRRVVAFDDDGEPRFEPADEDVSLVEYDAAEFPEGQVG